jgi:PLAT/LH2 domain
VFDCPCVDRVDRWVVEAASVGHLDHLRVRHDNAGDKESWFINEIEVEDIEMGVKFKFECRDWLALHQGDGVVDRLLPAEGKTHLFHELSIHR